MALDLLVLRVLRSLVLRGAVLRGHRQLILRTRLLRDRGLRRLLLEGLELLAVLIWQRRLGHWDTLVSQFRLRATP
ncbi:hypothetical protein GCM10009554_32980 [Kribbella koreensis]|uniref:Secreted protein n=2 Tax=Kribbella TaxID=182639 RepID=A0ABP6YAA6_9ACTN